MPFKAFLTSCNHYYGESNFQTYGTFFSTSTLNGIPYASQKK